MLTVWLILALNFHKDILSYFVYFSASSLVKFAAIIPAGIATIPMPNIAIALARSFPIAVTG